MRPSVGVGAYLSPVQMLIVLSTSAEYVVLAPPRCRRRLLDVRP